MFIFNKHSVNTALDIAAVLTHQETYSVTISNVVSIMITVTVRI